MSAAVSYYDIMLSVDTARASTKYVCRSWMHVMNGCERSERDSTARIEGNVLNE